MARKAFSPRTLSNSQDDVYANPPNSYSEAKINAHRRALGLSVLAPASPRSAMESEARNTVGQMLQGFGSFQPPDDDPNPYNENALAEHLASLQPKQPRRAEAHEREYAREREYDRANPPTPYNMETLARHLASITNGGR